MSLLKKNAVDDGALGGVTGGAGGYMNMKLDRLKKEFVKACKARRMTTIMEILGELQARGCYGWARETAVEHGITSI